MNFDFSDDQKLLREHARRFLGEHSSLSVVRRCLDGDAPHDAGLWRRIARLGWTATAIPEEYGGLGLGYLELCVIAEELGRALAPVPFSSSVYLATELILAAASGAQRERYLPALASGESIGTLAAPPTGGARAARLSESRGRLSGAIVPVSDGRSADFAIVSAAAGGGSPLSLFLVDLAAEGLRREAVSTIDPTRDHARLNFEDVEAEPLGAPGKGERILARVLDRAAVLLAFEQLGGADRALELARDYALERHAFGRPIGSFQAIKHRLADMYVLNVLARSNCYRGAWALSTNANDLPVAAAAARVAASEAFYESAKEGIQIHGGMGFTWEADAHLFYRRAELLALALGGQVEWKDRLIERVEASESRIDDQTHVAHGGS